MFTQHLCLTTHMAHTANYAIPSWVESGILHLWRMRSAAKRGQRAQAPPLHSMMTTLSQTPGAGPDMRDKTGQTHTSKVCGHLQTMNNKRTTKYTRTFGISLSTHVFYLRNLLEPRRSARRSSLNSEIPSGCLNVKAGRS